MSAQWPEIELQDLGSLSAEEASVVDMHSVLNILNILHGELCLVGIALADDEGYLERSLGLCEAVLGSLKNREAAKEILSKLPLWQAEIEGELDDALEQFQTVRQNAEVSESISNIGSVLSVLGARVREILERDEAPDQWVELDREAILKPFYEVFAAISKNSKGRYRIIYNLGCQGAQDYYFHLDIDGPAGGVIAMPPVFIDVMRDLIANARKYTKPGGLITAGLYESEDRLSFVVEDSGRGIPEPDIPKVGRFGYRAGNVGDVRTMGGGMGLTKALRITRQFGGRMWIASRLNEGTRVRIEIPRKRPRTLGTVG